MAESDPLRILFSHDRWATEQVLDACSRLSEEQFHQRFEMGPGSLHDTLTHIVGAMRAWTDTLGARARRPRIEDDGQRRTPAALRALHDEALQDFMTEFGRGALDDVVTHVTRTGLTFQMNRSAIGVHVATHGMHHRAQCLNMLRRLGVHPLPPSSVTEWTWVK